MAVKETNREIFRLIPEVFSFLVYSFMVLNLRITIRNQKETRRYLLGFISRVNSRRHPTP
jgi:hypothetical protein